MNSTKPAGTVATLTLADQVMSSASNALLAVALAQTSSVDRFGLIGLLVAVVMVCLGFNRGALGTPLLLTSNLSRRDILAEAGYAVTWALATGLTAGSVLAVVGITLDEPALTCAFGISLPLVLAQDVLRITVITLRRPGIALAADSLWTVVIIAIILANVGGAQFPASTTVLAWGVAGLLSGLLIGVWAKIRPRAFRILSWWYTYYPSRLRFGGLPAAGQMSALIVSFIAFETAGGVAAAGVRGSLTLFGPITVLISALPMVFVPHSARSRGTLNGQWRMLVWTSVVTSSLALVATLFLFTLPESLGNHILGPSWEPTRELVPFIGIECAAAAWRTSVYTFFQSQGSSHQVFQLSVSHLGLQAVSSTVAGLSFHSSLAIGVAIVVSGVAVAVAGVLAAQIRLRHHHPDRGEVHQLDP